MSSAQAAERGLQYPQRADSPELRRGARWAAATRVWLKVTSPRLSPDHDMLGTCHDCDQDTRPTHFRASDLARRRRRGMAEMQLSNLSGLWTCGGNEKDFAFHQFAVAVSGLRLAISPPFSARAGGRGSEVQYVLFLRLRAAGRLTAKLKSCLFCSPRCCSSSKRCPFPTVELPRRSYLLLPPSHR
nr:hypothetical protein CFP56_00753 [Quercus suber]